MSERRWPCESNERLCWRLDESLAPANDRKRGISLTVLVNFKTGGVRVLGPAWRNNAKDCGVLLNFCPFCGYAFQYEEAKPKEAPNE